MANFDALIIGFGKAGKTLAGSLAAQNWKVALVEEDPKMYGGTCINIACIPTKLLMHDALEGKDYASAIERKFTTIEKLNNKNYHTVADLDNAEVIDGKATFLNDKEVEVKKNDGSKETLTADKIFINTGAKTAIPPLEGDMDSDKIYTSTSLLEEKKLPETLTIVGGGYIGLEFATMYNAFGSTVNVIVPNDAILENEDEEIAKEITKDLKESSVNFIFGNSAEKVTDNGNDITVHLSESEDITSQAVLFATGRKPNTEGLGLENTSVKVNDKGAIEVNDHLETSVENIFALGDVKGGMQFTYTSLDDFRIVNDYLLSEGKYTFKERQNVQYSMFIDPVFSRIGYTLDEAKEKGYNAKENSMAMSGHPRSHVNNETRGIFKAVVDTDSKKILGAHLYGVNSEELINTVKLAMDHDIQYTSLRDMMYNHPNMSEAFNNLFDI